MWLADTSVWIDHFRLGRPDLQNLLSEGMVLMHPFVLGELACGNLKDRATVLSHLASLPLVPAATDSETLYLVEEGMLWGRGIGWVDAHLLASALLSKTRLWTLDKKLASAATHLGI